MTFIAFDFCGWDEQYGRYTHLPFDIWEFERIVVVVLVNFHRWIMDKTRPFIAALTTTTFIFIALFAIIFLTADRPISRNNEPPFIVAAFGTATASVLGFVICGSSLLLTIGAYLIPTIIAWKRQHPNIASIMAVNILLPGIGWVISLVWSLTAFNAPNYVVIKDKL
jgi:Superinfection immunity protein